MEKEVVLIKSIASWPKGLKGKVRKNEQNEHKNYKKMFEFEFLPKGYERYWFGINRDEFVEINDTNNVPLN